jgi:hypothetical protein
MGGMEGVRAALAGLLGFGFHRLVVCESKHKDGMSMLCRQYIHMPSFVDHMGKACACVCLLYSSCMLVQPSVSSKACAERGMLTLNGVMLHGCAGNASVFKAGIAKNVERQRLANQSAAAAEAAKKAGIMGKAKNVFGAGGAVGGLSGAVGGLMGGKSSSGGANGLGEHALLCCAVLGWLCGCKLRWAPVSLLVPVPANLVAASTCCLQRCLLLSWVGLVPEVPRCVTKLRMLYL